MQTFLPYASFVESARCLDRARLGKQRVECVQILNALLKPGTSRWENHPAVRMWAGHETLLVIYGTAMCHEWIERGYNDTCMAKLEELMGKTLRHKGKPWWLGDIRFHSSHRSNLLRKDAEWYGKFGWEETDDLPYFWPTKNQPEGELR